MSGFLLFRPSLIGISAGTDPASGCESLLTSAATNRGGFRDEAGMVGRFGPFLLNASNAANPMLTIPPDFML